MADDAGRCSQSAAGDTTNQDEDTGVGKGKATTPDQSPVEGDSPQPDQQLPMADDPTTGSSSKAADDRANEDEDSGGGQNGDKVSNTSQQEGDSKPKEKTKSKKRQGEWRTAFRPRRTPWQNYGIDDDDYDDDDDDDDNDDDDVDSLYGGFDEDWRDYKMSVRKEHDQLLEDFQIRCRFEAEKHHIEASWFESKCLYLEIAAALLGSISLFGVAGFLIEWIASNTNENTDALGTKWSRIGLLGFAGVLGAGVLQFLGKGSAKLLPSFKKRAEAHRKVTFDWNHLKHQIKATRIQLRSPKLVIPNLRKRYRKHISERRNLSQTVLVSRKTSNQFDSHCDVRSIEEHEKDFLSQWPVDKFKTSHTKVRPMERSVNYREAVSNRVMI